MLTVSKNILSFPQISFVLKYKQCNISLKYLYGSRLSIYSHMFSNCLYFSGFCLSVFVDVLFLLIERREREKNGGGGWGNHPESWRIIWVIYKFTSKNKIKLEIKSGGGMKSGAGRSSTKQTNGPSKDDHLRITSPEIHSQDSLGPFGILNGLSPNGHLGMDLPFSSKGYPCMPIIRENVKVSPCCSIAF